MNAGCRARPTASMLASKPTSTSVIWRSPPSSMALKQRVRRIISAGTTENPSRATAAPAWKVSRPSRMRSMRSPGNRRLR
ncbi:hypothetical protein D3C84_961490 [compost metagenome]